MDIHSTATFNELKHGLIMQIVVLVCLFVIQTLCAFLKNKNIIEESVINIVSDSLLLSEISDKSRESFYKLSITIICQITQ